ncbi:Proline-rich protein PRCC [Lasallia pustulata]|uniref:Proline-rich protein PRCC n=1 Tax=Lasallia pustulata TaxID=136370 RepID=A0A1W5D8L8_9LECA|nr:Proline-rich protein PRCC [Lasallia pustulata]
MVLVDYSDSEHSDVEEKSVANTAPKSKANPAKPTFQKVVDRSNHHKIRVSLPEASGTSNDHEINRDEPAAKRVKTGAGAFSGFNSFLPAPKRSSTSIKGPAADGVRKGGIGSGISLKTGSTPGFTREPMPSVAPEDDEQPEPETEPYNTMQEPPEIAPTGGDIERAVAFTKPEGEVKRGGNAMMFKPLSVARKPQKKKPPLASTTTTEASQSNGAIPTSKPPPKKSLFSVGESEGIKSDDKVDHGEYRPLVYEAPTQQTTPELPPHQVESQIPEHDTTAIAVAHPTPPDPEPTPQSLSSIAADLNLSASAKRQLLGRQHNNKANPSAINIVNFNTDQEYAANEVLRQAGEQVQHNPIRAIAPGKHSLKQLVSAASNQKDALEEQFATGRRNKKEAGSKYGW